EAKGSWSRGWNASGSGHLPSRSSWPSPPSPSPSA
uniref:Uncharacterized protein n=1 Tax=Aegilops tauschii subsp. strangulata TaxID=200361 RepID=A0A453AQJ9_AEGTS